MISRYIVLWLVYGLLCSVKKVQTFVTSRSLRCSSRVSAEQVVFKTGNNVYSVVDAIATAQKALGTRKFQESIELHAKLNVDPRRSDIVVRSVIQLPFRIREHEYKVAYVTESAAEAESAKLAGAVYAGGEELIKSIKKSCEERSKNVEFDVLCCTPNMMPKVGQLGRQLGPKGLLPSMKIGTISADIKGTVELHKGRNILRYRADRYNVVHMKLGMLKDDIAHLVANLQAILVSLAKERPKEKVKKNIRRGGIMIVSTKPERFFSSVFVSSTMGAAYRIDNKDIQKIVQ